MMLQLPFFIHQFIEETQKPNLSVAEHLVDLINIPAVFAWMNESSEHTFLLVSALCMGDYTIIETPEEQVTFLLKEMQHPQDQELAKQILKIAGFDLDK